MIPAPVTASRSTDALIESLRARLAAIPQVRTEGNRDDRRRTWLHALAATCRDALGLRHARTQERDAQALADKILLALRDQNRLRTMGDLSYQIARERFDWRVVLAQTLALYQAVLPVPAPQPHFADAPLDSPH